MTRFFDRQLALDARSLALGRIGLALVVLFDLAQRATNLTAHYSDAGVLPRRLLFDPTIMVGWSLHALFGSVRFEAVLFVIAGVAALALLVGFRTRAALAVVFVLTVSLHARNPYLRDGQDDWLRLVLFWALWLPLGRRFSIDARHDIYRDWRVAGDERVSGLCAVGLFAQLVLLYESAAIGKLQSPSWQQGLGLQRALQLDFYETFAGHWLLSWPTVVRLLNFSVIGAELLLPLLLFVPWQRRRMRIALVFCFIALHGVMGVFLKLGTFPWVCAATWIALLPNGAADPETPSPATPALIALPFVLLCGLVVVNTHLSRPVFERRSHWLALNLGLDQYWIVFSPRQPIFTGYLVAPAKRAGNDQPIDLFAGGGAVTWQRPEMVSSTFKDRRWRQFYRSFVSLPPPQSPMGQWREKVREATAAWLCLEDKEMHPGEPPLTGLEVYYVKHLLGRPEPVERTLLVAASCE